MHALIVVAHHDPQSLTHSLAAQVAEGLMLADSAHTFEIADLFAESFDPRFNMADHAVHREKASPPADVLAEQARIERADALVLLYPVYWCRCRRSSKAGLTGYFPMAGRLTSAPMPRW